MRQVVTSLPLWFGADRLPEGARLLVVAAALLGAPLPACLGSEPDQLLAQMDHASWTARDGAPQGINALAQAKDGTLWIGSEQGLVNFDGRAFTAFQSAPGEPQLPAEAVHSMCITRDDTLWIGFMHAGVARVAHGKVTLYPTVDTQPLGFVTELTQAPDGSIWAISNQRLLVRFGHDLAWHAEPAPAPSGRLDGFLIDSSQTLWIPEGGRLYKRPLAQPIYTPTDIPVGIPQGFVEMHDRSIWVADVVSDTGTGRIEHFDPFGHLLTRRLTDADHLPRRILGAPDGSIVFASQAKGLRRFHAEDLAGTRPPQEPPADVFTSVDGLTSNEAYSLLRDVDGNLWVGGRRGLDRLRKAQMIRFIPRNPEGNWHLCGNTRGLWISSTEEQLYRLSGGVMTSFPNVGDPYLLYCSADGDVWLADHAGIWQVHGDRLKHLPPIPEMIPYSLHTVVATADHQLYASTRGGPADGFWEYKNGRWTKLPLIGSFAKSDWACYLDSHGRLWIGYRDGRIALPLEDRTLSSTAPGLGTVNAFLETSHGMLAAGRNGIGLLHDNGLEMLSFADGLDQGIGGLAEARNGDLWLNTVRGVVRVSASELESALSKPGYHIKADLLTEGDFVGASNGVWLNADVARDDEGNLWFETLNSVMHIDPEHWHTDSRPPIVSIRSIAVDQRPLSSGGIIDPRPQALEIQYFGVNLTAPEQVIYKYRLDGFDADWQEAGHRTEAIYTRLPAGHYTFRVMAASSANGPWTPSVSSIAITVLPSFYQTTWFVAICVGTAIILLCWAFWARVRAITREVRARAEERADERIRIAREIHDTLLQGVQGLQLTFHVAVQKMSKDDESKRMLEGALSTADRIIIEGRNRVSRLRSEHLSDAELVASLENVGNDLGGGRTAQFKVNRLGCAAKLDARVADEIFFVAREALTNAFRHSQASQITLDLVYGHRFFTLVCRDDGRGFEPQEKDTLGHWGVRGMTERVGKLGGWLCYQSTPRQGTELRVSIPAYRAYVRSSRMMFYLRALSLKERNRSYARAAH